MTMVSMSGLDLSFLQDKPKRKAKARRKRKAA